MNSWTVYKHISPSGKVYIGITSNVKNRWAARGYYYCLSDTAFSRALKKYGWDNFQHEIIRENLSKQEACSMEIELIAYYKAKGISYNITNGGEGFAGKHSEEHVKHRVNSRIANSDTDYLVIDKAFNYVICKTEREAAEFLGGTQKNISRVLRQPIGYTFKKHYLWKHKKGIPVDIESIKKQIQKALDVRRQKMSEHTKAISAKMVAGSKKERESLTSEERKKRFGHGEKLKGKSRSEETKRRISEAAKGRDMSKAVEARKKLPYNPSNKKPVIQYLITGELVREFSSITQASIETGTNQRGISNCLAGRALSSGGFKWEYKN